MGCHSFALLFDDIDPCMCQADRDVFPSLAQAQASVANEVYRELGQPSVFLFCPTGTSCSHAAPDTWEPGAWPAAVPHSRPGCPLAGCTQHLCLLTDDCPDSLCGFPQPPHAPVGGLEISGLGQDQAADGLVLQYPCTAHLPGPCPLIPGSLSPPGFSAPQGMLCAFSPEYCSSLCSPSPTKSCYLLTLGQELLPGIGVIWTGECPAWVCGSVGVCSPGQAGSGSGCGSALLLAGECGLG